MNTELIAMEILETKILEYKENKYTLRLAQEKNGSIKYAYLIQNNTTGKEKKYSFTEEVSLDFANENNQSLFEYLPKRIQHDLESGII
jgi:hypothetical protein